MSRWRCYGRIKIICSFLLPLCKLSGYAKENPDSKIYIKESNNKYPSLSKAKVNNEDIR